MKDSITKDSIKEISIGDIDNEENIIKRADDMDLKPIHIKILLVLTVNGPFDSYAIAKLISKEKNYLAIQRIYSSVHGAAVDLEKMGLLKFEKPGKSEKNREKKPYGLTEYGLCKALLSGHGIYDEEFKDPVWEKIGTIVENWKPLAPLTFGKWHDLLEKVPKVEAIEALGQAMESAHAHYTLNKESEGIDAEFFHTVALSSPLFSTDKWINAIREDGKLNSFAIKSLVHQFNSHARFIVLSAKDFVGYVKALKRLGGDKILEELLASTQESVKKALAVKGSTETEQEIFELIMRAMYFRAWWPSKKSWGPKGALREEALIYQKNLIQKVYKKYQKRGQGIKSPRDRCGGDDLYSL